MKRLSRDSGGLVFPNIIHNGADCFDISKYHEVASRDIQGNTCQSQVTCVQLMRTNFSALEMLSELPRRYRHLK